MKRLALVCPEIPGHLNPMTALGAELQKRGHAATVIGKPDGQAAAEAAGLGFRPIGADAFPAGSMAAFGAELGRRHGRDAVRYTIGHFRDTAAMVLRDLPDVLRAERIDGVLVDQTAAAAGTVAEVLGIPFVSVANALALNQEPGVPPVVTGWRYREAAWARARNRLAYAALTRLVRPINEVVNAYRRRHGLPPVRRVDERYSKLAQIAQQPAVFDFPRRRLPACFHYAGPFHRPGGRTPGPEFPWQRLDGRPLVYASMGTLQNRLERVFVAVAEACAPLDVQLVITLGGSTLELRADLPGEPVVVPFADQLSLLKRAALVITHGGLNTALEALACGVPLVAIPITNDQPGVAARLQWSGAGAAVSLAGLSAERLRAAVTRVLGEPSYQRRAEAMRDAIAARDGLAEAAGIVERAVG